MQIAKTDIKEAAVLTFTIGPGCWRVDQLEAFAHALDRLYEVFQIITISRSEQMASSTSSQFDLVTGLSGYRMGRVPSLKNLIDFMWPQKLPCKQLCIDHIDMQSPGQFAIKGLEGILGGMREVINDIRWHNHKGLREGEFELEKAALEVAAERLQLLDKVGVSPYDIRQLQLDIAESATTIIELADIGRLVLEPVGKAGGKKKATQKK